MRVACHFTIPQPPQLELDAAVQDGLKTIKQIGGEVNFLYPGKTVRWFLPRFISGFHDIVKLRRIDRRVDLHHVFSNGFYPYPIFPFLKKPVIVSSVTGVASDYPIKFNFLFRSVEQFVVQTQRDAAIMRNLGFENVSVVTPGIELAKITGRPCRSTQEKLVLLMGSAPWNEEQFKSKGIDLLLQAVQELPWLEIIFLWRGILQAEMMQRVELFGVGDRVKVITEHVDVDKVFEKADAAVVLAQNMHIVKAYPHSILEALAAGKPVLLSGCLQLSEFVREHACGVVVENLDAEALVNALKSLRRDYLEYCGSTRSAPVDFFSSDRMVKEYRVIYNSIIQGIKEKKCC